MTFNGEQNLVQLLIMNIVGQIARWKIVDGPVLNQILGIVIIVNADAMAQITHHTKLHNQCERSELNVMKKEFF